VEVKVFEKIFKGVHHAAQPSRDQANKRAQQKRTYREGNARSSGDGWHFEQWSSTEPVDSQEACRGAGNRHWHQAPWSPLEEQELDSEENRGNRCRERSRHTRSRASDQQCCPLSVGDMHPLRDKRPDGATRHDDWAFGAEGAA
jgi:hypothetical protein